MDTITTSLLFIAGELNAIHAQWGIGGSLVLKHHGLIQNARDIDLLVSEADIDRVVARIDALAQRQEAPISETCKSAHFYNYLYKGISIDVIAGFTIYHTEGAYIFPVDAKAISMHALGDTRLPYTSLEDWFIAYTLMPGREAKASMLFEYLQRQGVVRRDLLKRSLLQPLPEALRSKIISLIQKN